MFGSKYWGQGYFGGRYWGRGVDVVRLFATAIVHQTSIGSVESRQALLVATTSHLHVDFTSIFQMQDGSTFQMQDGSPFEMQRRPRPVMAKQTAAGLAGSALTAAAILQSHATTEQTTVGHDVAATTLKGRETAAGLKSTHAQKQAGVKSRLTASGGAASGQSGSKTTQG